MIRKFIQDECAGICVSRLEDWSFKYPSNHDYYTDRKVSHEFWFFNFEDERDAILFKLKFNEFICEFKEIPDDLGLTDNQLRSVKYFDYDKQKEYVSVPLDE